MNIISIHKKLCSVLKSYNKIDVNIELDSSDIKLKNFLNNDISLILSYNNIKVDIKSHVNETHDLFIFSCDKIYSILDNEKKDNILDIKKINLNIRKNLFYNSYNKPSFIIKCQISSIYVDMKKILFNLSVDTIDEYVNRINNSNKNNSILRKSNSFSSGLSSSYVLYIYLDI